MSKYINNVYNIDGKRYFLIGELPDLLDRPVLDIDGTSFIWYSNVQFFGHHLYIIKPSLDGIVNDLLSIHPPLMGLFELFSGIICSINNFTLTIKNGLLHKENGPALENINGTFAWYLDGDPMTSEEYWAQQKDTIFASQIMAKILGTNK